VLERENISLSLSFSHTHTHIPHTYFTHSHTHTSRTHTHTHTGIGALANTILEVMRRCHVRCDIKASQIWIELPTTVTPGELNRDQFEHVKDLCLVRFKGKECVLSNWFCAEQKPWAQHRTRTEISNFVSISILLPLALQARRRVLRGNMPHENVEWPCFLCFACCDGEMYGETKSHEPLFKMFTEMLSGVMSFSSSLPQPTPKTLRYFMTAREFLPIPEISCSNQFLQSIPQEEKEEENEKPLAMVCVNVGKWISLVPPSQISDFLSKTSEHLKQATSNATNLAATSVSLESEMALSGGIPSDIYGLQRWQQVCIFSLSSN
jgi:hypothetical protein